MKYKIKMPGKRREKNRALQMLTTKKAVNLQLQMRGLVITEPVCDFNPRYVAGVDVSVRNGKSRAAVVTVDIKGLLPVETATAFQSRSGRLTKRREKKPERLLSF